MTKKLKSVRIRVDTLDNEHTSMLQALRQFHQISKKTKLVELVILGAVLDVGSLPCPKNMTAPQREGWEWCNKMAIKYSKPFKMLLQKRKVDNDQSNQTKKSKRRRTQKKH